MKLTIETEWCTCTIDQKDTGDDGYGVLVDLFRQASLGIGFGQTTIDEYTEGP